MVLGHCKTCGEPIRSRKSDNNSAQTNFLAAVRRHYKNKHPNTIGRRISRSNKLAEDNPTVQDFIAALQESPRAAIEAYEKLRKRDFILLKRIMDAFEPLMPVAMKATWKAVEAAHEVLKR